MDTVRSMCTTSRRTITPMRQFTTLIHGLWSQRLSGRRHSTISRTLQFRTNTTPVRAWERRQAAQSPKASIYVNAGAVVPQGASPVPAAGQPFHVDPSSWQIYTPGQGLAPVVSTTTSTPTPTRSPPPPPTAGRRYLRRLVPVSLRPL